MRMRNALTLATLLVLARPAVSRADTEPGAPPEPAEPTEPVEPVEPAKPAEPKQPDVPPEPTPPPPDTLKVTGRGRAGYDKGFFIKTDDDAFALNITGRIQPFFLSTYTKQPANFANDFEIKRLRLILEGHLHTPRLLYKFQSDFGKGVVSLKDGHFDVELSKDLWLRMGQWKRPFSRQQINSSGRLETPDRAITDKAFGAGRDIGIAIGNRYEKSPDLEWVVGVFNGTGDVAKLEGIAVAVDPDTGAATVDSSKAKFSNVPKDFLPVAVARVGVNRNGIKGYSEADLEGGPLRYGVAASVQLEGDFDGNDASNQKFELDYVVKSSGVSSTGGFYVQTSQNGAGVRDAEFSLVGAHVQAGYMATKKLQMVGRFAYVNDPRSKTAKATDQQEIQLAANWFGFGHDGKFAGGVKLIKNGDAGFADTVVFELGANIGW